MDVIVNYILADFLLFLMRLLLSNEKGRGGGYVICINLWLEIVSVVT